ncbi:hypothetical protein [Luteimonas saliphila]|uniref:hypothetical protein n=1 Tax=Luteimonas saliphila TaxID=2804919 RepID=UPI00192D4657|nr:hypothetical protein [Luteimonas saliphila]
MSVRLSTGYLARRNAGASFASIFDGGCFEVRTGTQPTSADLPVTGDLIGHITRNGAVWTPGSPTAGLRFDASGRQVMKRLTDAWRLIGSATGIAGWARLVGPVADPGTSSLSLPRIDGAIDLIGALTDAQFFLPTLGISADFSIDINYWWLATPPLPGE